MLNYNLLPHHMQEPFRLYIENGISPGSFATAVLENDLMGAMGRADDINRHRIWDICNFVHNEAPHTCHGSEERVEAWIATGGLYGMREAVA